MDQGIGTSITLTSSVSQIVETEETEVHTQQQHHDHRQFNNGNRDLQRSNIPHRISVAVLNFGFFDVRDDAWSCSVVLLTFWFFASMTLILGLYGSYNLQLGPNCSYLIEANPIFVHSIKAQQLHDQKEGPMLYGFHKYPLLDVKTTWSQNLSAFVDPHRHKEWSYYLNAGSQVDISYDVKAPSSTSLSLVIAQGKDTLIEWLDDPAYPNTTLSWNVIYGYGNISQEITNSDTYYVAVGNSNSETVLVYLNITIHSLLYNTSDAYFKCSLSNRVCSFQLQLMRPNAAILTSPGAGQVKDDDDWYIKVSFVPQWLTYLGGSCIMTAIILAVFNFCNKVDSDSGNQAEATGTGAEREPLLSPKDDISSSLGSSYDTTSNDEEDLEEKLLEGSLEGKVPKEGEATTNPRRLCVICFDAPQDCFFLPCGHCATCFTCGSRIAEEAGTCPICRRKMKKVRKIFPV